MLSQLPWPPCQREETGRKSRNEWFWHVALELAKGRCQVEDGGGTVSLVINIDIYIIYINMFEGLFSYAFPFARLKQRQARDGTKIVNTEGAKRQDVRSCAKSCNSSVREACDASASWSLASIVDFASWPQFPQDQSLPAKPCKAMQSHAKPCKAMQSLQGLCTPCIRFPSKDFEYMHGIFNTSHSHESCSPCSFPSALGASTSLLDVWHELKASSKVLSLELC